VAQALNLPLDVLHPTLPLEVVSTGLRYLVVPVTRGLEQARIVDPRFEAMLGEFGAEFAYLVDVERLEGRHWNNDGIVEDVATGSGAGCVAAYLRRHDWLGSGEERVLHQGRFVGRPSGIRISALGPADDIRTITVGGDVAIVGEGVLQTLPGWHEAAA
jgi:PhzF family phenazine biosynthesis protein